MQDQQRFVMAVPAPGFTNRVMTRLAERERARTQRRALLGSALLVGAVVAMLAFALVQLVSAAWVFLAAGAAGVAVSIFLAAAGAVGVAPAAAICQPCRRCLRFHQRSGK